VNVTFLLIEMQERAVENNCLKNEVEGSSSTHAHTHTHTHTVLRFQETIFFLSF